MRVNHPVRRPREVATAARSLRRAGASLIVVWGAVLLSVTSAAATGSPVAVRDAHPRASSTPSTTNIASLTKTIPGYNMPNGHKVRNVASKWLGSPLITPIVAQSHGFDEIRLPMRPNGSTTWVKATDVLESSTPYRLIVNVKTTHLQLLKNGRVVLNVPVGVGTTTDPTPTGQFFVTFYAKTPGPGYGPWLMMTSAHSDVIANWANTGDALISLHGPLGADAQIGTKGARVSHGCIRLHLADQRRLRVVPDGTPITIIN